MRKAQLPAVVMGVLAFGCAALGQTASYNGGSLTENFDALPATGTTTPFNPWSNGVTLAGWHAFSNLGEGTNSLRGNTTTAVTVLRAGDGTANSGALYSFGTGTDSERAIGTLGSGTPGDQVMVLALTNTTTNTYTEFSLSYRGEQWRDGGNATGATQVLEFDCQVVGAFNPSDLAANNQVGWTHVADLDFVSPTHVSVATGSALDGNAPANSLVRTATVTGILWGPGQVLYLRWWDNNDAGNDHAFGIDDLTFSTPAVTIEPNLVLSVADSPDPVRSVGSNITYTINLQNAGLAPVVNAIVTGAFAGVTNPQLSLASSTVPGTTLIGGLLTIPVGPVGPQETLPTITVVLTPHIEFPATHPLTGVFIANPRIGDANPDNNEATVSTIVINETDLSVTMSHDQVGCEVSDGSLVTFTVTVTNNSFNAATGVEVIDLLPNVKDYNAGLSSASVGTFGEAGGVVTWTVGSLAPFASATLTLATNVSGTGGIFNGAAVTSTTTDLTPDNNTAFVLLNSPVPYTPGVAHKVTAATIGDSLDFPLATTQISIPGFPQPPDFGAPRLLGSRFGVGRMFLSPNGTKFIMVCDTELASGENTVLVVGDVGPNPNMRAIAREGVTNLTGVPGEVVTASSPSFDRMLAIDDAGNVAFTARVQVLPNPAPPAPANPTRRVVMKGAPGLTPNDPYIFLMVAAQGDPVPASLGITANWGATFVLAGLMNDGTVAFSNNTSLAGGVNEVLVTNDGNTLFAREGTTTPTGQFGSDFPWASVGSTLAWQDSGDQDWASRGFKMAPNGIDYLIEGTTSNPDLNLNSLLVKTGVAVAQEGTIFPGSGFAQTIFGGPTTHNTLLADGTWWAIMSNAPATPGARGQDFVARDGVVKAKTGDPIHTGATETWGDAIFSSTFTFATGRGTDYVIGGLSSRGDSAIGPTDTTTDTVLVWNGQTIILREGDPVDYDNDPSTDDGLYAGPFIEQYRAVIGPDRCVYVPTQLRTRAWPCKTVPAEAALEASRMAILRIPLPPAGPVACNLADIVGPSGTPPPDGHLGGEDFLQFMGAFAGGGLLADVVGPAGVPPPDGHLGGEDFLQFLAAFTGGC